MLSVPNNCARRVLRYPVLWGDNLLLTQATAMPLIAAANERLGRGAPVPPAARPYGCAKAEAWLRYRCPWLFCRTGLRDVAPDLVLRVAPSGVAGHYRVVEEWRFRQHYVNLRDLDALVEAFARQMRRDRQAAVLSPEPVAPG